ncbi:MAG: response regulator transcription factor [Cyanothece sp. SIO1E1]|nr:response regulator transcription factor [Cyanothece sp. SIO1E1]
MIKTIIVEDEKHNQELLERLLQQHFPDLHILQKASNVSEGLSAIKNHQPALVFLDVEMPDGNAFDLLSRIHQIDFEIIFVTAYDHYALQAIRFCAIDYLLKPIKIPELLDAVKKVLDNLSLKWENQRLKQLIQNLDKKSDDKRIALPTADKTAFIPIREIIRCQGENNYTSFYLTSGNRLLVSKTLKEFEEILQDYDFARVHQSHLVNLKMIESYHKTEGGYLIMLDGSRISISRHRKDKVLHLLMEL